MSDGIELSVSRHRVFPRSLSDENDIFEQRRRGSGNPFFPCPIFFTKRRHAPLRRPLTHDEEFRRRFVPMFPLPVSLQGRDIFADHRMKQFSARVISGFPNSAKSRGHPAVIVAGTASSFFPRAVAQLKPLERPRYRLRVACCGEYHMCGNLASFLAIAIRLEPY